MLPHLVPLNRKTNAAESVTTPSGTVHTYIHTYLKPRLKPVLNRIPWITLSHAIYPILLKLGLIIIVAFFGKYNFSSSTFLFYFFSLRISNTYLTHISFFRRHPGVPRGVSSTSASSWNWNWIFPASMLCILLSGTVTVIFGGGPVIIPSSSSSSSSGIYMSSTPVGVCLFAGIFLIGLCLGINYSGSFLVQISIFLFCVFGLQCTCHWIESGRFRNLPRYYVFLGALLTYLCLYGGFIFPWIER